MRTDSEIVARIKERQREDTFGFETVELVDVLPYSAAKEFLKPEAKEENWEPSERTREAVLTAMGKYMEFAIDKATDHRGISASRSISHFQAWVWLLGDEDYAAIDWENYPQYGVPILRAVAERFSFHFPDSDSVRRMSLDDSCRPDCQSGCGGE